MRTLTPSAYSDRQPSALFRSGSFVWKNSLFIVGGHTDVPFEVTSDIWRADIVAYVEAPEGLWREVNTTLPHDGIAGDVVPSGRYGHSATVLATEDTNPTEVLEMIHDSRMVLVVSWEVGITESLLC